MKTSEKRSGRRALALALALTVAALSVMTAGLAPAVSPASYAYLVTVQPRIAGRVVAVRDQRIIVDTERGERVALDLGSRAVVPVDPSSAPPAGPEGLSSTKNEELEGAPPASSHRRLLVLLNLLVFGGVGGVLGWRRLNAD